MGKSQKILKNFTIILGQYGIVRKTKLLERKISEGDFGKTFRLEACEQIFKKTVKYIFKNKTKTGNSILNF